MSHSVETFASAIVMAGSFNPAIFTPDWVERNKLIGSEDAEFARAGPNFLASRQAAVWGTEWFGLQVLENQFSLTSRGALSHAFRDLAEGIASLVPHTPVTALGLNFMGHYKLSGSDEYHKIGDVLAPKEIWHELFTAEFNVGVDNLTMKVRSGKRSAEPETPDVMNIQIQPSKLVPFGVFLSSNDHREWFAKKPQGRPNAEGAAEVIAADWEPAWQRAVQTFDNLLRKSLSG